MKKLLLLIIVLSCCGCSRAFWAPDWDKAETEKKQYEQLIKQTKALERIVDSLERMEPVETNIETSFICTLDATCFAHCVDVDEHDIEYCKLKCTECGW